MTIPIDGEWRDHTDDCKTCALPQVGPTLHLAIDKQFLSSLLAEMNKIPPSNGYKATWKAEHLNTNGGTDIMIAWKMEAVDD